MATEVDQAVPGSTIRSDAAARLDRLPWLRFHTLIVAALGITWLLDGLEVTLAGSLAPALKASPALHFSDQDVGDASSAYLAGAVIGALLFGWLTDRFGRRRLFFITLLTYVVATAATAFAGGFTSFALCRFLTGLGIGGEYSAINSTIQEFTPARFRGATDLAINATFWVGAAIGAAGALLLQQIGIGSDLGWRFCFGIGAALGLFVLAMRIWVPESPRWLYSRGHLGEARSTLASIEAHAKLPLPEPDESNFAHFKVRTSTPIKAFFKVLLVKYRSRSLVALTLMSAQAFFYNAIFFTYALVLTTFYGVDGSRTGIYLLPFAAGNFLGPVILGHLFDRLGRRMMLGMTYIGSGILLTITAMLFRAGVLDATTQTLAWSITFFLASSAASAAYLTVSENFPLEVRALAIATFYALGTALGGIVAPALFGRLIAAHSRDALTAGYMVGAALMLVAGVIGARYAVAAERRSLEQVAAPLEDD
jgi:MFS family permease